VPVLNRPRGAGKALQAPKARQVAQVRTANPVLPERQGLLGLTASPALPVPQDRTALLGGLPARRGLRGRKAT
jgi:hypothetical protein